VNSIDPAARTDLRTCLSAGEALVGVWSTLASPATAVLLAESGELDYLVTDLQHGVTSESELPGICAAAASRGVTPLARVRSSTSADIGRALDLGAHGVFLPNVGNAEHVAEVLTRANSKIAVSRSKLSYCNGSQVSGSRGVRSG
jgi:2-keto-3-deoxy-L-rhamnonate aldolase RhmA